MKCAPKTKMGIKSKVITIGKAVEWLTKTALIAKRVKTISDKETLADIKPMLVDEATQTVETERSNIFTQTLHLKENGENPQPQLRELSNPSIKVKKLNR